ncbi:MAG TPA: 23S rRNA (cytidine(2498)-2'-O)-methyltransferase RlmM [Candidatus Competibacteraceae bacterium]|nr:23S rRNA (cytidine(2498)-2'-O)-methyltransferase RlmM [Candidatus Competibacteraceae bacterium]
MLNHLILYCRPGFEGECAAEIQERAAAMQSHGYAKARPGSGWVLFSPYEPGRAGELARALEFRSLIFARQLLATPGLVAELPVHDRLSPLLAALDGLAERYSALWLETADTNEAKALSVFCRKFAVPARAALERAGRLAGDAPGLPRLHLFFLGSAAAYPALSWPDNASPWPMGIPRLRFPAGAPSRSTLKLEEALLLFLDPAERAQRLAPGMRAVDLGAAPGGWTWQLVRRHLQVSAIDNGPLDKALLDSGLVEHRREDGFRYRPPRPVEWMVCDMVESPSRIARLVAQWLAEGCCRESIFNLKLPMKKRYVEVKRCIDLIAEALAGIPYRLALKQLYHDREEVTGHLRRL